MHTILMPATHRQHTKFMYDALKQIGMDEKQIAVYQKLLILGQARASVLAYQLRLPRTTVQNILLRLEKEGIVSKSWQENIQIFSPINPEELVTLVENHKRSSIQEFNQKIADLKHILPDLTALIGQNKKIPNVKFYRGIDGVRKTLFDTLKSKTELRDFANIDAMFEYAKEINDEYVSEREKTNIKKRSLLLDTEFARQIYESRTYSPKSHAGYKWIDSTKYPFSIETNIYDGKVSYITYVENDFTSVIIENEYIYQMHLSTWNLLWDLLPEVA